MKACKLLLVGTLVAVSWTFLNLPSAEANCAPPSFVLSQSSGTPGSKLTVTGRNFIEECNDTNFGLGNRPLAPAKKVKVFFNQGKKKQQIGLIDANSKFEILAEFAIPQNASQGAATIVVETRYGQVMRPVAFTIRTSDEK